MRKIMSCLLKKVRWLIVLVLFILCGATASASQLWLQNCSKIFAVALIVFIVLAQIYKPAGKTKGKALNANSHKNISIRELVLPEDADEILGLNNYLVLDTETTGLDPISDKVVQIAIITVRDGKPVDTYTSFINPKFHMPEEASKINHITDADLVDAPSEKSVANIVLNMIDNQTVVAHNANFDFEFINCWASYANKAIHVNCIDTLKLSKKAFPGLTSYSLQRLIKSLKIKSVIAHRADGDALATQQLFELCKAELKTRQEKLDRYKKDIEVKHTQIKPTVDSFDKSHPLYHKTIVFTGCMGIPRDRAMQAAVNCGAILRGKVTERTDYLCCGEIMVSDFGRSKKKDEAMQLNKSGTGNIKIISEQEFLDLVMKK